MRCPEFQKRISDGLSGALPEEIRRKLENHIRRCPSCRDFERAARLIQEEAPGLASGVSPEKDWMEDLARLKSRLAVEAAEARPQSRIGRPWKWALAAAPVLIAAAVGMFFLFRPTLPPEAPLHLAAGERMGFLAFELEDNPELMSAFNQVLESSLGEDLGAGEGVMSSFFDDPILFQDISDEDLAFVLEELKKELKS